MKIKVAFAGIGGYANETVGQLLRERPEAIETVAAVDPYYESAPLYRVLAGKCRFFDSLGNMYAALPTKDYPDLVIISSPIQFHAEQIECAVLHGANVLCEKPMTGDISDVARLGTLAAESDKCIAIGYQWSFSQAIGALKSDIMRGVLGKPLHLKSLVFWPRDRAYFTRSTGWAGKVRAKNGKKILDSIVNNATAHYLHNMLYVLGQKEDAAMPVDCLEATLLRVNDIETFDTATVRFTFACGATGLLVVSHSTEKTCEPMFEYTFEKGKVVYSADTAEIRAELNDGTTICYGDPFAGGAAHKIYRMLEIVERGEKQSPCGVNAAKAQVEFVAALHAQSAIHTVAAPKICEKNNFLYVEGLDAALERCYRENKLLEETEFFDTIVTE